VDDARSAAPAASHAGPSAPADAAPPAPPVAGTTLRTRRGLLAGAAGALAALAAQATLLPARVAAAAIELGQTNTTTRTTTIRNTKGAYNPKALVGRITDRTPGNGSAGLQGINEGRDGNGVIGVADRGRKAYGVWGTSAGGVGTSGTSETGTGVAGFGKIGTFGRSQAADGTGVFGKAEVDAQVGVSGEGPTGVNGYSATAEGVGVYGFADTTGFAGVFGAAQDGYAGYFDGDVLVTGDVLPAAAFVQVDHPEAPAARWYRLALVGAFEQVSIISGNARTGSNGRVTVRVPDLFASQHRDFRYQLTPLGRASGLHVARTIEGGRFVIAADEPDLEVSWQVTGLRSDPSAARPFRADVPKSASERGRFLQPRLHGQPAGKALAPGSARGHRLSTAAAPTPAPKTPDGG
jgi:hypothetical protein